VIGQSINNQQLSYKIPTNLSDI